MWKGKGRGWEGMERERRGKGGEEINSTTYF